MTEQSQWKITNKWKPPHGFGLPVCKNGQLGYAKSSERQREKLASDLAKLLSAPVPTVELTTIRGEEYAVSYVGSPEDGRLSEPNDVARIYSDSEITAVRHASGLLAFTAWIDAFDHCSGANYIVQKHSEGTISVVAVDFEDAFKWKSGEQAINVYSPDILAKNFDQEAVDQLTSRIENLPRDKIIELCAQAEMPEVAPILLERRISLRAKLRGRGLVA